MHFSLNLNKIYLRIFLYYWSSKDCLLLKINNVEFADVEMRREYPKEIEVAAYLALYRYLKNMMYITSFPYYIKRKRNLCDVTGTEKFRELTWSTRSGLSFLTLRKNTHEIAKKNSIFKRMRNRWHIYTHIRDWQEMQNCTWGNRIGFLCKVTTRITKLCINFK